MCWKLQNFAEVFMFLEDSRIRMLRRGVGELAGTM